MGYPDSFAAAFEHSITWEDDVWQADPVDVEEVHKKARQKFHDLLEAVTGNDSGRGATQARILLFHGQSGAGKTHLVRALRTRSHRDGKAYFGYAQMTPDVGNYADYFLRRLINSLEKPYDPDDNGESGLARLTRRLVEAALPAGAIETLREGDLGEEELAHLVLNLADDILISEAFADQELDVNIIRALLYLQRSDPRIDQRVRQYLFGRELNELSHKSVRALDPNSGDGRAFEIIEALGKIIWTVEKSALVFCIDQVEDLRNFEDPEERFTKAVGNLMQIANRVPSSIIIISVLEEFYGQARAVLHQSYIDRIEKAGPVALYENRTAEEARLIIGRRLEHEARQHSDGPSFPDSSRFFGPEFFEEFAGLSTRRLLEHAQNRMRGNTTVDEEEVDDSPGGFISTLASALGFAPDNDEPKHAGGPLIDYREMWDRFCNGSEAEIPSDDHDLLDVLANTLTLASTEWGGQLKVDVTRPEIADDMPVIDVSVHHPTGHSYEARIYLCNRPTQGGGLKRQLDKVLTTMQGRTCFMLRASDFPPNKKNQTAQAYRKFRDAGGRSVLVPIPEWERMMAIREFHMHHRNDPGFGEWFEKVRLVSGLISVMQLLRLDLLGRSIPTPGGERPLPKPPVAPPPLNVADVRDTEWDTLGARDDDPVLTMATGNAYVPHEVSPAVANASTWADWTGWNSELTPTSSLPANDDELPLPIILDENGGNENSIFAGRESQTSRAVTLNKSIMKRHAAFLGGSGSGKTTLALSLIEQLLSRGIPAVLIDRKGDLCSYANPEVWLGNEDEGAERI
ncbi:MAG: DUF853 family protein, partial [Alphaproteobacteria bacterium]|nr:DUF853 family protein [Alphaproteobacteria bacterium]